MRIIRSRSGTSTMRLELRELGLVGAGILIASVFWLSMFVAAPILYSTRLLPVDIEAHRLALKNTLEAHELRYR